ncbi:MAG: hypothetical protein HW403_771 [Dehalococcoidia bacterium]|nr:hypothetical protein [Dehalococcoidia bacterium]
MLFFAKFPALRVISVVLIPLALISLSCSPGATSRSVPNPGIEGGSSAKVVDSSDEVPVFPGAVEQGETQLEWGIQPPLAHTSYKTVSWRYFNVKGPKETLVNYYQGEMGKADLGWTQAAWGNIGDKISWGIYTKKSGETAAWVVLNSKEDGSTLVAVGLGKGKIAG